jgi:hypothetical protein
VCRRRQHQPRRRQRHRRSFGFFRFLGVEGRGDGRLAPGRRPSLHPNEAKLYVAGAAGLLRRLAVDEVGGWGREVAEDAALAMNDNAQHWFDHAKEARAQAEQMAEPDVKQIMLAIAASYEKAAKLLKGASRRDRTC